MTPTPEQRLPAVVLAGGKGTRLAPYTTVLPKPLMPIGGVAILDLVLRRIASAGFGPVTISVGHLAELIRAYVGDGSRYGIPIELRQETEPLGTAGPLALVPGLDRTFLLTNGDVLTDLDFGRLLDVHRAHGGAATIAAMRRAIRIESGVLETDAHGRLVAYTEKPSIETIVSLGIYLLEPEVLRWIDAGERLDLPELVARLLDAGRRVQCYFHEGHWFDIGCEAEYREAVELFERDPGVFLGRP